MDSKPSHIPIDEAQLSRWTERANALLVQVKWSPRLAAAPRKPGDALREFRESAVGDIGAEDKLSLVTVAKQASRDPVLVAEPVNHALTEVRQGLRIGMHLSNLYTTASGLQTLVDLNARGGMSDEQKTEFRAKYETASAIAVFCAACHVRWALGDYMAQEVSGVTMEAPPIPEVHLLNPVRALDCAVYYYAAALDKSGLVHSPADFVKMTLLYFEALAEEIRVRADSLRHAEPFATRSYQVAGTEFAIHGFETDFLPRESSVEFNRVEIGEIVGNRDAKHKARRLAERLICYDAATKRNPMMDLGGLETLRMGHGEPGTGKSLQIAATATMLDEYSRIIGVPFLFWPMPDTIVSTFQGGSAERMMGWMKPLRDPTKIIYAPIDDAENALEDRTRQGVSAGVREVIAVFLRNTEGAYAVKYGNAAIEVFTNLPDQLDRAVLSRIMDRVYIGGARTVEDFADQDHLWWRKYEKIAPGFVGMAPLRGYEPLSAQKLVGSLSRVYESLETPADERARRIFDEVRALHKPSEHAFFAALFERVKREFPLFTSRDVRNIQQAVSSRIMDFDLEPEWKEKPEVFFRRDYDTKRAMIVELMKANMKGMKFHEVRLQETIRYLDGMMKIAGAATERQVQETVRQIEIRREAERRVLGGGAGGR
jgi:hypothetical protein